MQAILGWALDLLVLLLVVVFALAVQPRDLALERDGLRVPPRQVATHASRPAGSFG